MRLHGKRARISFKEEGDVISVTLPGTLSYVVMDFTIGPGDMPDRFRQLAEEPARTFTTLSLAAAEVNPAVKAERKRLGLCLECGDRGEMIQGACVCRAHGRIWG